HNWNGIDKIQLEKRMYRNIHGGIQKVERKGIRYIYSTAAAILLLLVSGYLYINEFLTEAPVVLPTVTMVTVEAGSSQRSLLLNDGTYVLLNPGSILSFPDIFDQVRKVELMGEAWFDVQRD